MSGKTRTMVICATESESITENPLKNRQNKDLYNKW